MVYCSGTGDHFFGDCTDNQRNGIVCYLETICHVTVDLVLEGVYAQVQVSTQIQELSYRKQIARKLRTQYVEGIYRSNYP